MSGAAPIADAAAQARALIDDAGAALPTLDGPDQIALARALKAECHAAWSVAPQRAIAAARAAARIADAAGAPPECRAYAHWTGGLAALVEGDARRAEQAFVAASAALDAIGAAAEAAQAQVPLGIALAMQGRHPEAIEGARRLRERFIAQGDDAAAAKIDLNLGSMLVRLDRHAEAELHYRAAFERFERLGDVEHAVMATIGHATALTWQFDFAQAGRLHAQACASAARHGFPVLEALARGSLGQLELHRGHYRAALRDADAARRLLEGRGTPQRRIDAERTLADVYLAVQLVPEALAAYARVSAAAEALDAPLEQAWAEVHRAQALAALRRLDEAAAAVAVAQEAFARAGHAAGLALAQLQAARLAAAAGRHGEALRQAEEAQQRLRAEGLRNWQIEAGIVAVDALAADPARRDEAAVRARAVLDEAAGLPLAAAARVALARIEEVCGRRAEAVAHYAQAADEIERQRSLLPADDVRIAFAADKEAAFDALVRLATPGAAAERFAATERGRARTLHESMAGAEGGDADPSGAPADDEEALRQRHRWLHAQWSAALRAGAPAEAARRWREQLAETEAAWVAAERTRRWQRDTGSAQTPAAADPGTVETLQHALDDDTAYLAYHVEGECWRAVVVTRDGLHAVDGRVPDLQRRLGDLRLQLDAPRLRQGAMARHGAQLAARVRHHLRTLGDDLFGPLAARIGDRPRLVISPHRALHALPWSALEPGGVALVRRHAIVRTPSAAVWLACRSRPPLRGGAALLMGSSDPALPQVAAELTAIDRTLAESPLGFVPRRRPCDSATLRGEAPQARLIHLACHAEPRADNPRFSALHLDDGLFTLGDAGALRSGAGLVTLSACGTAISRIAPGNEVLGLAHAFLSSGVATVVASLWSVDDAATAELMARFYGGLAAGRSPGEALGAAQCAVADDHPHPFHWAAFAVHGAG